MFSLTVYFFAGFIAFMFTLVCAALLFLVDDIGGHIVISSAAAIGAIVTGRCVQLGWQLLCIDEPSLRPLDDRLVD